jgi:uncharacterized membrane protein YeaQ/YmgE (transglycosylase-associated protein family)
MTPGAASAATIPDPAAAGHTPSPNWTGWINAVVGAVIMLATMPGRRASA